MIEMNRLILISKNDLDRNDDDFFWIVDGRCLERKLFSKKKKKIVFDLQLLLENH